MKKISIFLLLLILFLTGCSKNKLESISVDELSNKMSNKESLIVYFSSKNDEILEKKLVKVLEDNNLNGYKIDIDNIDEKQKADLSLKIDYSDPSIVFIVEGNDPTKLSHVTDDSITSKQLLERLKDMKFIK